jgi:hypothetical protein
MWNDPIVEETRKVRDEIAARFNYDVKAIGEYYKSKQESGGKIFVHHPAKLGTEDEGPSLISDRV